MGLAIDYMILSPMFQYVDVRAVNDKTKLGKGLDWQSRSEQANILNCSVIIEI